MSVERALKQIADDLARLAGEEVIAPSEVKLAATRVAAQAEMIDLGIDKQEPSQ